jgi:hypothetical protein
MIPKKRSMDEVLAAIGAAMAETGGRTLEKIDPAGDAAIASARRQVAIRLHDYQPYPGADPGDVEWRYRKELERALHGPLAVPGALRAWMLCNESQNNSTTAEERILAAGWVAAMERARAEGMKSLTESHTAWFEVKAVRVTVCRADAAPPSALPVAPEAPRQSELF